ncbi:MAG: hypothetical protein K0R09_400 [Clostridiales bacterium]|nr:hypothetical protein [Clostridiales bacterium]
MYKNLVKNKKFLLLSTGGFISSIGDYLYNIGLVVYLYSITNSIGTVALMWLSRGILRIPVQYIAGIIADRYNKKRIIVLTNLISGPIALSLIFVNEKTVWISFLIAFLLQSLDDIDVCSENAILPELVNKEELSYSNSVFSFLSSTCVFLSPAIGGLIYKLYGSRILFVINGVSFLVSGMLLSLIKYKHVINEEKPNKGGIIKDGIEGCKVLSRFVNVKTVFLIMTAFAIMGRFFETYKIAVADILLKLMPEDIIFFDYALAVGGLLVPIFIKLLSRYREISIFVMSSIIISIGYIGFGYSHNTIVTLIILVFLGIFQNLQGLYTRTIIQKTIPLEYIGRVFSFYKIVLTLFALLGIVAATPLYNAIGIGKSFLVIAIISILLCMVYMLKGKAKQVFSDNR